MEQMLLTVAGGLIVLAIGTITGLAFKDPKLFMGVYPHAMTICGVLMVFGCGAAYGGKALDGLLCIGSGAMAALMLWMVLRPIAAVRAQGNADGESAGKQDPPLNRP